MTISFGALVRRWGGRAVGLTLTGIGLYVVAPSLLTMFGSWPQLRDVEPWWFAILVGLVFCSAASIWWLTRLALGSGPADEQRQPSATHLSWGTAATAHLAGNAAGEDRPRRAGHGRRGPGQGADPGRSAPGRRGVGTDRDGPADDRGAAPPPGAHHPGADHRPATGAAAPARPPGLPDPRGRDRRARRHHPDLDPLRGGRRPGRGPRDPRRQARHHGRQGRRRPGRGPGPGGRRVSGGGGGAR